MNNKIVILDDSVTLYQHYIDDSAWEKTMGFPRGGLTYLISNNNIKFYAFVDYFYRNCLMTMELPLYLVDEELGIDGEYDDIHQITEILNRIFPALNGEVDLTPYLKKREAEETYQPIGDYQPAGDYLTKESGDTLYQPIGDYLTKESGDTLYQPLGNYQPAGDYALKSEIPSLDGYATQTWVQNQGYINQIKTINNQSLIGTGNIEIETGGTIDAYSKVESDERFQPKGNYLTNIKTINGQSLSGTGNIEISTGGSITVDSALSTTSTNPVQNKVITGALNGKLDATAYTAPVQSDWNATSGLAFIKNKPTIPTVPTNISAFNNDAGYITSAATVFNNYYTKQEGDGKYATQNMLNNAITNIQNQINNLIDAYSECCTAMTLSGTAVIYTTSASQIVDIGSATNIQVFASSAKTCYPIADGKDTYSLGVSGNVPCTFKLIEGLTTLGSGTSGRWTSESSLKYQFNGGFTKIGQNCFANSTRLQILDFHNGVTEIRDRAFDGCTALKSLIFRSTTPPTLYTPDQTNALDTLYSVNTSFNIYVPAESLELYRNAPGWSTYASLIRAI